MHNTTHMDTEADLSRQSLPISKLEKYSSHWVIKVLVPKRGSVQTYNNSRHAGVFQTFILVDKEGTKIQTTLFNTHVEKWEDYLKTNKTYFIINGRLDDVNPKYSSVHKELEIAFTDNTVVRESINDIPINTSSNKFITLDEAQILEDSTIFDVVCMLTTVKPIKGEGRNKRREIIVTNGRYDHTTVTLWREFAELEGDILEKMQNEKPVLGLCDVKVNFYRGNFGIATIPFSTVLINPAIREATELQNIHDSLTVDNEEIIATTAIRKIKETKLGEIIDGILPDAQDSYYRFTAKITKLLNKEKPWYSCCLKCFKKVDVMDDTQSCPNCNQENAEYKMRFCLRVEVMAALRQTHVVLFEAATTLLGCTVTEYIQSTLKKNEESKFYRKLVSSIGKEFNFLARVDWKKPNSGSLIVEEIHEIEDDATIQVVEQPNLTKKVKKKSKKYNKDNCSPALEDVHDPVVEEGPNLINRPRKQKKKYSEENSLPVSEDVAVVVLDEGPIFTKRPRKKNINYIEENTTTAIQDIGSIGVGDVQTSSKRQRKKPKKYIEENCTVAFKKIKVEKD